MALSDEDKAEIAALIAASKEVEKPADKTEPPAEGDKDDAVELLKKEVAKLKAENDILKNLNISANKTDAEKKDDKKQAEVDRVNAWLKTL